MKKEIVIGTVFALALIGCSKPEEPSVPPPPARPEAASPRVPTPPAAVPEAVAPTAAPNAPAAAQSLTEAATGKFASLIKAFQSADPATRALVQKSVSQLSAAQYSDALKTLAQVAGQPNLTAEQQQAVEDTTATAQKQAATGAVNDLKAKLPFGK